MPLITPKSYKEAPEARRMKICNGTGANGTPEWITKILDSFDGFGINFREVSNRHDWMYHFGVHWWHKLLADLVFLINMILHAFFAIFQKPLSAFIGNLIVFPFRVLRAFIYFLAVLIFGWRAFYHKGDDQRDNQYKIRHTVIKFK